MTLDDGMRRVTMQRMARENTSIRLDPGQSEDLAAIAEAMRARMGVEVTPAAVLRAALAKGIASLKAEVGIRDKGSKGKR
jgi:hypothetical protein